MEYMPVRYLNEYVYCPRLGYLEWVDSEFRDNYYTLDGTIKHNRVDRETLKQDGDASGVIHATGVSLSSEQLGLSGRIDVLEETEDGFSPVEYKRGKVPDIPGSAYESERVQVCAYGLLLKDNGYNSVRGYLCFADSRQRVEIPFDDDLVSRTLDYVRRFRETASQDKLPPPLDGSRKCEGCSLAGICLPDETNLISGAEKDTNRVRRLVPARDDSLPVYVMEQGSYVSKDGELLVFKAGRDRGKVGEVRLIDISQLCVFGNVQISTQAIRELCSRGISICYFSRNGWFYGMTQGHSSKNVALRMNQYSVCTDPVKSLEIARCMINGKIKNSRTIIRRNHPDKPLSTLKELASLSRRAKQAQGAGELLGIEGLAARNYFSVFQELFKGPEKELGFQFTERNKRPPGDPVNAMLSYVYAILVKDLTVTLNSVGMDPCLGVFHRPRYGKPALALDLAEEFRSIAGDSVVLSLINNREVERSDFIERHGGVIMSKNARTRVVAAYERRMDTLIRHPVFKYTISYRRTMEVQARLLGRVFSGEVPAYLPFCTR